MRKSEFIHRVQEMAGLPTLEMAEEATRIVLHLLSHRITKDEAEDAAAQLPEDMQLLWDSDNWFTYMMNLFRRKQLNYRKLDEFYAMIADRLQRNEIPTEADRLARVVFHVLKEQISPGEVEDIAAQLPEEIEQLWLAA